MMLRKGETVLVTGTDNADFNGCYGVIVEVYGRSNHKAIVDVTLRDGRIRKLLHDEEYHFSTLTPFPPVGDAVGETMSR